ncbi:DUF6657 family protein [Entomospira culicis]|uniref:Uncharacterized protein n=1 Tax=Entomospira culicis TaxID=2719989 RepID=A0A968GFL9_9SPIO|nr:DUF6657 family protein [Entomospira culicis]NIZ19477.1 hypothetical protein [Entomospira culicis]NIZ69618.1 hypothetical protein [Entomospira culicis]WDI36729.1 hypothetical protein PVA46_05230 [Entomospira culicis]WDI38358.1 hypothetical protein PVA47_05240 [Entomospira culicis]
MIKSAYERAMERANQIAIDPQLSSLKAGQELAGLLYKEGLAHFVKQWHTIDQQDRATYLAGLLKSLLSNIVLPQRPEQQSRITLTLDALQAVDPTLEPTLHALSQLLTSYTPQYQEFSQQLSQQLQQHLDQKERAHYARTGERRAFTLQSDPEVATLYADEMKKFQLHFSEHLTQHKWRILQQLDLDPEQFSF